MRGHYSDDGRTRTSVFREFDGPMAISSRDDDGCRIPASAGRFRGGLGQTIAAQRQRLPRPKPDISSVEAFERALLNARAGNKAVASAYYDHGRPSRIRTPLSSQGTALHNPCRPISLGHPRKWHARGIVSGFLLFSPGSKSRWARQAERASDCAWSQKPEDADFRLKGSFASFRARGGYVCSTLRAAAVDVPAVLDQPGIGCGAALTSSIWVADPSRAYSIRLRPFALAR